MRGHAGPHGVANTFTHQGTDACAHCGAYSSAGRACAHIGAFCRSDTIADCITHSGADARAKPSTNSCVRGRHVP